MLGIGLLFITEGAAGEAGFVPAALGAELLFGDEDENEDLLVCKECQKDIGALHFATEKSEKVPEKVKKEGEDESGTKSAHTEEYLKSQTHCLHIDAKTAKKCRRMVYRKSGYCYMHQRE